MSLTVFVEHPCLAEAPRSHVLGQPQLLGLSRFAGATRHRATDANSTPQEQAPARPPSSEAGPTEPTPDVEVRILRINQEAWQPTAIRSSILGANVQTSDSDLRLAMESTAVHLRRHKFSGLPHLKLIRGDLEPLSSQSRHYVRRHLLGFGLVPDEERVVAPRDMGEPRSGFRLMSGARTCGNSTP